MRVISGSAKGTILYSLQGSTTRPTLDRVKEALFNIIQNEIIDAQVLDLFAGSGALGIEALSRGAKFAVFSDKSIQSVDIIKKNIEKTHLKEKAKIIKGNYLNILKECEEQYQFDLIFIDPPYADNIAISAVEEIISRNLLKENGVIILETNDKERELKNLSMINVNVYDLRKYGRVNLIFLNRKG